ncbi:MAG: hypothetical protein WKG06_38015 [Segetibacter sp.]
MAVRFFTDSIEWKQALHICASRIVSVIKGTVTWLARQEDTFPAGEESFSIKVKAAPQEVLSSNTEQ